MTSSLRRSVSTPVLSAACSMLILNSLTRSPPALSLPPSGEPPSSGPPVRPSNQSGGSGHCSCFVRFGSSGHSRLLSDGRSGSSGHSRLLSDGRSGSSGH